jgi:hypothetical protein
MKCHFPNCDYQTSSRNKMHLHHIIPREVDPKSKATIPLCPTHHALIFVEESKHGQHSIKTSESLIIRQIFDATSGKCILYEDMNGTEIYHLV